MPGSAVVRHLVTFGRVLREGGLEVGPGRIGDALRGLEAIDLERQEAVSGTLGPRLVSRREDLDALDRAFDAWFLRVAGKPARRPQPPGPRQGERRKGGAPGARPELDGGEVEVGGFSDEELLRSRDFAEMTPDEFGQARRLIRAIAIERPQRRT